MSDTDTVAEGGERGGPGRSPSAEQEESRDEAPDTPSWPPPDPIFGDDRAWNHLGYGPPES